MVSVNLARGRLQLEGKFDRQGKMPVNMSGGMASYGEVTNAQGLQQVCDMTRQLRGTAPYQIPGVKTAFARRMVVAVTTPQQSCRVST